MRHLYVCREIVNPGPTICLLYTMVNLKGTKNQFLVAASGLYITYMSQLIMNYFQ